MVLAGIQPRVLGFAELNPTYNFKKSQNIVSPALSSVPA